MKPGFRPIALFPLFCAALLWGQNTSVAITWPANDETVANIIAVKGKSAGTVSSVAVSLDSGAYLPIDKTGSPAGWRFTVYTKNLPVGRHTVVARATGASGAMVFSSPVTFNVVHPTQDCNHSLVGSGIFCEQNATDAQSPSGSNPSSTVNLTFSAGYAARSLIVAGACANARNRPWTASDISNSAGFKWSLVNNTGSGYLDDNLVQCALYYATVPAVMTVSDTIRMTDPGSVFTVADALVYSGIEALDGAPGSALGWGGPGADSTTGNYRTAPRDLNVAFTTGAPTIPGAGWTERVEDNSRPFTMFVDQIATGVTANATWQMNEEGWVSIGVAFKPSRRAPDTRSKP
jgi:hypothetical protein